MIKKNKKTVLTVLLFLLIFSLFFYFINDKKLQTLIRYNDKNNVKSVSQYFIRNGDTVLNGKSINYNSNGVKISENNFVNNRINGLSVYYFESGKPESIHYLKNCNTVLESKWYYNNGNVRKYLLFDDFGKPTFIINFNEKGEIKNYDGLPLAEIYQYKIKYKNKFKIKTNQYLKVGDVLKYKYFLANIPYSSRNFKLESVGYENSNIRRTIRNNLPAFIDVEEVLVKKGRYAIKAVVEYKFNDKNKTIIKDSAFFEVKVN